MEMRNHKKSTRALTSLTFSYSFLLFTLYLGLTGTEPLQAKVMTKSDRYCGYLLQLQQQEIQRGNTPGPMDRLVEVFSSLTQKLNPKDLEQEAFKLRLTFEEFKSWAESKYQISIPTFYKTRYLQTITNLACGSVDNSIEFGDQSEGELQWTAQKKFDPTGYPYFESSRPNPESTSSEMTSSPPTPTNQ